MYFRWIILLEFVINIITSYSAVASVWSRNRVNDWCNFYRPERSCGKVMFLHLSVILFTGGGTPSQHAPQVTCPGGVSIKDPRTVTSRRYASYWNAFLFFDAFNNVSGFFFWCIQQCIEFWYRTLFRTQCAAYCVNSTVTFSGFSNAQCRDVGQYIPYLMVCTLQCKFRGFGFANPGWTNDKRYSGENDNGFFLSEESFV